MGQSLVRSADAGWTGAWSSLKNNMPNKDGGFIGQQLAFCKHHIWAGEGGWDGCLCGLLTTINEKPCNVCIKEQN